MSNAVTRAALRARAAAAAPPDAAAILGALPVPVVLLDRRQPLPLRQPGGRAVPRHLRRRPGAACGCDDLVPRGQPAVPADRPGPPAARRPSSDHDLTLESPRLHKRGITVQGSPLPEEPGAVLLVLQDASAARALDRQLAFRGAARSVTGMAAILAHEVKNPLSGIRGAAQLLEASVAPAGPRTGRADPRRGRPHPRPGRPDGDRSARSRSRAPR